MPSLIVGGTQSGGLTSGGVPLVSGSIFSGTMFPVGGIQLKHSNSGIGPVFVCLPNLSGAAPTFNSGGSWASGGLADGLELNPGDSYFVSKNRLVSGVETIRLVAPVASSGTRIGWEFF